MWDPRSIHRRSKIRSCSFRRSYFSTIVIPPIIVIAIAPYDRGLHNRCRTRQCAYVTDPVATGGETGGGAVFAEDSRGGERAASSTWCEQVWSRLPVTSLCRVFGVRRVDSIRKPLRFSRATRVSSRVLSSVAREGNRNFRTRFRVDRSSYFLATLSYAIEEARATEKTNSRGDRRW